MTRRSSRRMWHAIAAFVPLPLIAVGIVVGLNGQFATEVELELRHPDAQIADPSVTGAVSTAGKQMIAASLANSPGLASAVSAVSREGKSDRLKPTSSEVALKILERRSPDTSLFMPASYTSPFNADFQVDAFRPSPGEIAYSPTPEVLGFRYKGETQAEFEAR